MDNFLVQLYKEDLDKLASADYQKLLNNLSIPELEALLGINKVAVAGPNCPEQPTGEAAKDAKVTAQAEPKKKGSPEMPSGKTASVKVAQNDPPVAAPPAAAAGPGWASKNWNELKSGWSGGSAELGAMKGPAEGKAVGALSKSRIIPGVQAILGEGAHAGAPIAKRLGNAARMLGPHALLAGGIGYGIHKMLQPNQPKYAQADLMLLAARATRNAPGNIKTAAARYTATKLVEMQKEALSTELLERAWDKARALKGALSHYDPDISPDMTRRIQRAGRQA